MNTEKQLSRITTLRNTDLVRVVNNGASRNITFADFSNGLDVVIDSRIQGNVRVVSVTTDTTIADSQLTAHFLSAPGGTNLTINLPAAASVYDGVNNLSPVYTVIKVNTSANNVVINPDGAETINGDASWILAGSAYPSAALISDGSNWWAL